MSKEVKMNTEISWSQKVLAKLNLNEEGKIGLFKDSLVKTWEKAITVRKKEIAQLKEKEAEKVESMNEVLDELTDEMNEVFITVNPEKIKTREARIEYIESFDAKCNEAVRKVKKQEEDIKATKEYTASVIKLKEQEIEVFENKLSFIS